MEAFNLPTAGVSGRIGAILQAIEKNTGVYQQEAIDEALRLKKDITPYLLHILEDALKNPEKYYAREPTLQSHLYALVLLSHFREPRAHQLILDLFSLPGRLPSALFGDMITENLPAFLYLTCSGSVQGIKQLVTNKAADSFCRTSAATALTYCVAGGVVSRGEILEFFGSLFTGKECDDYSEFWSFLACDVYDLYPGELMDTIRRGYAEGLISSGVMRAEKFEEAVRHGSVASALEKIRAETVRKMPEDVHRYMGWWACFRKEDEIASRPVSTWEPIKRESKIGRNAPCPCGSGKKFKKCCLQ